MIENFELLVEGQLAGDLTAAEVRTFTAHLSVCPDCRARYEAHRAAAAQLAKLATAPLAAMSAGFTDRLMRALPKGPPPGGSAAPAAGTGMIVLAIGAAVVVAGMLSVVARHRSTPAVTAPVSSASASEAATPSPASTPSASATPLPTIARPSASVGGLDDDGTSGRTTR